MSARRPPLRVVLKEQLRADPRKTAVLALLTVIMVTMYGRWMLRSKPVGAGPARALALPTMVMPDSAAITVPPALRLSRPLLRQVDRDPFAFDPGAYPLIAGTAPSADVPSMSVPGDVDSLPTGLVLQSTLCGPSATACVNGKVVRPGDEIEGFVLERIAPDHVVVQRNNVRLTLWLK